MKNTLHKIVKTAFLFSIFFSLFSAYAQAPQAMSYQAVIRNASGILVSNTTVSIDITIFRGSITGANVYEEYHSTMTNANGLATVTIGDGLVEIGDFYTIDWSNGPYFMYVAIDPNGGGNYTINSSSQLMSVPYALSSGDNKWTQSGNNITNKNFTGTTNISSSVDIPLSINGAASFMYVPFGEGGSYRGYFGSYYGADNDIDFGTYGANPSGKLHLVTDEVPRLTVDPIGNVGIGTLNPTTKLEVNGFTKFGTDAPAIKIKKLTETTSGSQGGNVAIPHGLNSEKILSVTVLVEYFPGVLIPSSLSFSVGFEFGFIIENSVIRVYNSPTNSGTILSKPIKVMITYEE
jgi:hypothetical protein